MAVTTISIQTPDGAAEAYLTGEGPGVLFFMDAFGLRPQIADMMGEIASWGYTVLAPNVFYRIGSAAQLAPEGDMRQPGVREAAVAKVMPAVRALTSGLALADIRAYVAELAKRAPGPIGTCGYCMGARLAVRTAGAYPEAVKAVAGFHGGGLVTDAPDSPHLALAASKARYVFGHADNDGSNTPQNVRDLGIALSAAGLAAKNEVYPAKHGYTMADTSVYDEACTRRAFVEMRALFDGTLKA